MLLKRLAAGCTPFPICFSSTLSAQTPPPDRTPRGRILINSRALEQCSIYPSTVRPFAYLSTVPEGVKIKHDADMAVGEVPARAAPTVQGQTTTSSRKCQWRVLALAGRA